MKTRILLPVFLLPGLGLAYWIRPIGSGRSGGRPAAALMIRSMSESTLAEPWLRQWKGL